MALHSMGFISCLAVPETWYSISTKTICSQYYEYPPVNVNDILAVSHQPQMIMTTLSQVYCLKDGSSLTQPQEGHFDQCLYIFANMKKYKCSTMVLDNNLPRIGEHLFHDSNWT
jgi:hypothetical protein